MTEEQINTMRMQYAGAIGLLADVMPYVRDEDERNSIEQAVRDWATLSGWRVKRILNRMDLIPPKEWKE